MNLVFFSKDYAKLKKQLKDTYFFELKSFKINKLTTHIAI